MSIRKKTVNRLLLISVITAVAAGGLGGAYFVRRSSLNARAMATRHTGMEAAEAKDYSKSLGDLGNYLGRFQDRPEHLEPRYKEALFYYALSRQMVEEPKLSHLQTAVSIWKRFLGDFADKGDQSLNLKARQHMLEAQVKLGWGPEALDSAQELLKLEPTNQKALSTRANVLAGDRKFAEASDAVRAWLDAFPFDLDAHILNLRIMGQQAPEMAAENTVKYAEDLRAREPDEPCYELLAAIAVVESMDVRNKTSAEPKLRKSAELVRQAASRPMKDAEIVRHIVRHLDLLWMQSVMIEKEKDLGLAGASLAFAKANAKSHPDNREFQWIYALRLYQAADYEGLASELAAITPETKGIDDRLLVLKAAALFSIGKNREKEARDLLHTASTRARTDMEVSALYDAVWFVLVAPAEERAVLAPLTGLFEKSSVKVEDLKVKLEAFKVAQTEDSEALNDLCEVLKQADAKPVDYAKKIEAYFIARAKFWQDKVRSSLMKYGNPLSVYLFGDASINAQDLKAATDAYLQVSSEAPGWAQAHTRLAELAYMGRDRNAALQRVELARLLTPGDPDVAFLYTLLVLSNALPDQPAQIDNGLAVVKDLQTRFSGKIRPDRQQQIAAQLSRLGKNAEATAFLNAVGGASAQAPGSGNTSTLLMARLLVRDRKFQEAQDAYDRVLEQNPSTEAIMEAADLAGSLNQKEKVEKIIAKLDQLNPIPGGREMIWANYYSRHGTPKEAADRWKAAIAANPANAQAWQAFLAFCLRVGKTESFDGFAAFKTSLPDARRALPENPAVGFLGKLQDTPGAVTSVARATVLDELADDLFVRPLFIAYLETASAEPNSKTIRACLDALVEQQMIVDTFKNFDKEEVRQIQDKLITTVQKIADENPDAFVVHNFLVSFYGITEKYDNCVSTAQRVMKAFPNNSPLVAQNAIRVLAAAARWDLCLEVAKEWRRQTITQPMAADIFIADCYLNLRRPAEAIAHLTDPYINEIRAGTKKPDDYDQVFARFVRAQLNAGQVDAATQSVSPLLAQARWRGAWMESLANLQDDRAAAAGLTALEAKIPADASDERIALAVAWNVVGRRSKNDTYEHKSFSHLDTLNTGATKPALEAWGKRLLATPRENLAGVMAWTRWVMARNSPQDTRAALAPLLKSNDGLSIWISLADDIVDSVAAMAWLETARASLPQTAEVPAVLDNQKVQMASSYKELAFRQGIASNLKDASLKSATDVLDTLSADEKKTARALTLRALIAESNHDYAGAAEIYREQLTGRRDDPVLLNNYANVLAKLKQPGNAQEAIRSIGQAIRLQPQVAALYDTQSSVYVSLSKDYSNALDAIKKAIDLEPQEINWRISRIWILYLDNQRDLARTEFARLNREQLATQLNPDSQQKLAEIGLQ